MAKTDDIIRMSGKVDEVLPNAMHTITATLGGRLRKNNIRILLGDAVEVEMSPYDLNRGRVVYRNK